jgi:hypothetical protein
VGDTLTLGVGANRYTDTGKGKDDDDSEPFEVCACVGCDVNTA